MIPPKTPGLVSIQIRPDNPDFLDLPWTVDLGHWPRATERSIQLQRGLSRHEVQFVDYGDRGIYALKELPEDQAEREYGLLLKIQAKGLPAVEPVGHAQVLRPDGGRSGILITRFLDASHPYRVLFLNPGLERYRERLLDAMAGLLVKLHLAGVFWGDCSLSNILFRRDAGQLGAYLVDAETSEVYAALTDGQRRLDLMIMEENLGGDLLDIGMVARLPEALRPEDIGTNIRGRYEALWAEVNREEVVRPDERWRIQERVLALNALGFSVKEIQLIATGDSDKLVMRTLVTDRDYHRHRLQDLTGLVAEERQAEMLLNEIEELRAGLSRGLDHSVPAPVAAFRWLSEYWEVAQKCLAPLEQGEAAAAELYCQVLEHKWFLSERARKDVGLPKALDDYLAKARIKAPRG